MSESFVYRVEKKRELVTKKIYKVFKEKNIRIELPRNRVKVS